MLPDIREIRKIRAKLGLTQSELAKKAGVSQSLIAKIERGRIDPSYNNAKKILEALSTLSRKNEKKAKDVMNTKIIWTEPDQKVKAVVSKMKRYGISQLPVKNEDKIIGLVTESCLLEKLVEEDIKHKRVFEVMEGCPPVVSCDTNVQALSDLLKYFPIVLVSERGKIRGVVTKSDLIEKL